MGWNKAWAVAFSGQYEQGTVFSLMLVTGVKFTVLVSSRTISRNEIISTVVPSDDERGY